MLILLHAQVLHPLVRGEIPCAAPAHAVWLPVTDACMWLLGRAFCPAAPCTSLWSLCQGTCLASKPRTCLRAPSLCHSTALVRLLLVCAADRRGACADRAMPQALNRDLGCLAAAVLLGASALWLRS